MKRIAIETPAGIIAGRDAIYLDEFAFPNLRTVQLRGELNTNLCDGPLPKKHFVKYLLTFTSVVCFRSIEYDFDGIYLGDLPTNYDESDASSFDVVEESPLIAKMHEIDHSSKISSDHRHYIVSTYDDVLDIVATRYDFLLGESKSRNGG